MRNIIRLTGLALVLIFMVNTGFSQVKIKAKPGEVFDLSELGAIVLFKNNKVVVEFVMPVHGRNVDYRDIDIKKDDEIIYINGTKIKSTIELEKIYNEAKIGDEIKFGIKRNGELGIISFKKADPESFSKRKMMKIKVNGGDSEKGEQEIEINGKKYKGKDGKVIVNGKEMTVQELMNEEHNNDNTNNKQ